MDILQRDKLKRVGFEGVREHRLVFDARITDGRAPAGAWPGMGSLVYLADARLLPYGATGLQEHRERDVICVMLEGRLVHEGSLEHGKSLAAYDVQVQAGGDAGFSHQELNPDDTENRMIQLWVLAEHRSGAADYHCCRAEPGRVTRVYGGPRDKGATFPSRTCIDIARLNGGQTVDIDKPALVYVCEGRGFANEDSVSGGTLLRCDQLTFDATENACLIIIHEDDI
jgi:redox-sensitive bicupin YhaK (pirin superfamily)